MQEHLKPVFILFLFIVFPVQADVIKLKNGDAINAEILEEKDDVIIVKHPSLGVLEIQRSKTIEDEPQLFESLQTQMDDSEIIDSGLFGFGLLRSWERLFEIGLNGAAGATDYMKFRAAFNSKIKDEQDRWDFRSEFIFQYREQNTQQNRIYNNLIRDWFVENTKWFYFAQGGYDWDQFKTWEHRMRLSGGAGYRFIKEKDMEVNNRLGIGATYLKGGSIGDKLTVELWLGLDWIWQISEKQSLDFNNTLYPNLTQLGEYRNVTTFSWTHHLSYYKGLGLKFGVRNEYDTTQIHKNNLIYNASFVWGL